jgi:1,4-alpha-glucan branching enzyme
MVVTIMNDMSWDSSMIEAIVAGRSGDPFAVLGRHGETVRALLPGATGVEIVSADGDLLGTMELVHPAGLFAGTCPQTAPYRLRIDWNGVVQETEDPYSFGPLLGELDLHLIAEGRHRELAACLGAHVLEVDGIQGVRFAVWAPNASRVWVVGDFNAWDGRRLPMRLRHEAGVWEIFLPRLQPGARYKYEILGPGGHKLPLKADPIAAEAEPAPLTASIVADPRPPEWTDAEWMAARATRTHTGTAMSIYEVHAASWMRAEGGPLSWDDLADRLIPYALDMGFTHIEFLPIMVYPFGGSWGYQPLGQFAPTAEMGRPGEFARLVDRCHAAGIGVILDWVPAHFPSDPHGLAEFDGTRLYEHADPREGLHKDWNTLIYNLGRNEVRGFLIASALHWLEYYHIDGLRVDAVASMLYRDYSRNAGEWVPNIHGGRENLESVAFLQELNLIVAQRCPGALTIAEESTSWPGVTAPVTQPGDGFALGFSLKWNMGWMHDTLHYMEQPPIYRSYNHGEMTFSMIYAYSERFVLPLSHDESVHGKGSLLTKMPGDPWQQFANLRAYLGWMWTHPGRKLLFMGGEFGQVKEWNHDVSLDWHLLDDHFHRGLQRVVRDLNQLYAGALPLHQLDDDPAGFRWVIGDDRAQSVFAFLRFDRQGAPMLVVSNLTPVPRTEYRIGVPQGGLWDECFNSDAGIYGGSGMGNSGSVEAFQAENHGFANTVSLTLPPLSTILLRPARPASS